MPITENPTLHGKAPANAELDFITETVWLQGFTTVLTQLSDPNQDRGERAELLQRIDAAAISIDQAGMQTDAFLAVLSAAVKDHQAGLITEAELENIAQAGLAALREGPDDETGEELATIERKQAEIVAAEAELDLMQTERGSLPISAEEAARHTELLHQGLDIAEASVGLVGDGRNALGDAARAMAETRGELPNADADLLARQLEACDRLREADAAVIEAHVADVPMMHDLIDVTTDAYRDGTIWPGLDEIYAVQVLHDRIEEVREAHGREPEAQHNEQNVSEPSE